MFLIDSKESSEGKVIDISKFPNGGVDFDLTFSSFKVSQDQTTTQGEQLVKILEMNELIN